MLGGFTAQRARVAKAIKSKWKSLAAAAAARDFANNYFSRGDFALEPEVAVWLERETGYRAGWMMFGELPEMYNAAQEAALSEAFWLGYFAAAKQIERAATRIADPTSRAGLTPEDVLRTIADVETADPTREMEGPPQRKAQ